MTSASEGGAAHTGEGDIALSSVDADAPTSASRWWWLAAVLTLFAGGIAVWQTGDGDEPSALVTATDSAATSDVTTSSTSADPDATSALTTPNSTAASAPVDRDPSDGPTTVARPVVPASTTTAPASTPASTSASTSAVETLPSTIVVSATAVPSAPQVSIVDDAITEAIVIDAVPNTSLDGADRTPVVATPTTSGPPLACEAAPTRLGVSALADAGALHAENADGSAAHLALTEQGIGVIGGRDAERIDYSAVSGASERVFVDLGASRCAVELEIVDFEVGEWNGVDESMHWVGLDGGNRTVAEGWSLATADRPIVLNLAAPVERLLLEAAPYGATAAGWPVGADRAADDNSDFVLVAVIVK